MESITIHRGEILQIQRMITQYHRTKGNLHGLYTESSRPVILLAFGGHENERNHIDDKLTSEHGLKKLGDWYVKGPASQTKDDSREVSLVFGRSGELIDKKIHGSDVQCEIIEDQSAFRLFESVTDMLQRTTGIDNSKVEIKVEKPEEIQVKHYQWYSTEKGQKLLKEIFSQLTNFGFQSPQMSRNTTTQDFTIIVHDPNRIPIKIDFPSDFPSSLPSVTYLSDEPVEVQVQQHQVAESLCSALFDYISSKNAGSSEPTADSHSLKNMSGEKGHYKLFPKSDENHKKSGFQTEQKQALQTHEYKSPQLKDENEEKDQNEEGKNGKEGEDQKERVNDQKQDEQEKEETLENANMSGKLGKKSPSVTDEASAGSKKHRETTSAIPNDTDIQASSGENICKKSAKELLPSHSIANANSSSSVHVQKQSDVLEQKRSVERYINRTQGTKQTRPHQDEESNASLFASESKMEVEGSDYQSESEPMDTEL